MRRIMKRVLSCMAVLVLVFALGAGSYAANWSGFPQQYAPYTYRTINAPKI